MISRDRAARAIRDFCAEVQAQYPRHLYQFEQAEVWVARSGDLAVARGTYGSGLAHAG